MLEKHEYNTHLQSLSGMNVSLWQRLCAGVKRLKYWLVLLTALTVHLTD